MIILVTSILVISVLADDSRTEHLRSILGNGSIQINTTQESALDLSNHWLEQAFSSLMAAVAQEQLNSLPDKAHHTCARRVKDLREHAKCVADILDASGTQSRRSAGIRRTIASMRAANDTNWVGAFRVAREKRHVKIVNRQSYTLKGEPSPFTRIAKQITKTVRSLKNKKETRNWREIMVDVKKQGEVIGSRKKIHEMLGRSARSRAQRVELTRRDHRPLANDISDDDDDDGNQSVASPEPMTVEQIFEKYQQHPEAILDDDAPATLNMTDKEKESMLRIKLVREAVKMGLSVAGQNVSDFDRKSLKFASPRFFALAPEEHKTQNDTINILSPSLFSLHDEGEPNERQMSLPSLLGPGHSGDKDAWMDLLTEVTGVADSVDDAAARLNQHSEGILMNSNGEEIQVSRENVTNMYGEENYRKIKVLEKLHGMYTPEQMEHFNTSGYTVMTDEQREMVYGESSPFADKIAYENARNVTMAKARKALHHVIREVGNGKIKIEKYDKRMKDIVASPILFASIVGNAAMASQPLILSPVVFTSLILSPSIWGAVILSPWVFIPVILAPRILAPIIVSPAIFSPVVLSPLALDPLILVPGVANPIVLSPFVLTPFVLSPQVMTPLILSPFALSPFILTPTALSPVILSPFVLSPSVLSPSFATAVILSPYALSPSVMSPPTLISVFASPSLLS